MNTNSFTLLSTGLDTIDNSVTCNKLLFHLFINRYSHQIPQTGSAESKKRDCTRDSRIRSHTSPTLIGVWLAMQQLSK